MNQTQQLRRLAERSAAALLVAALCVFPLYIDKFSNLGVVKFTGICKMCIRDSLCILLGFSQLSLL